MKIKKFIAAAFAICLLLSVFGAPAVGAIDGKTVTSGAVVEAYQEDRIVETANLGSLSEAWSDTKKFASKYQKVVMTLGENWEEDEVLTIGENQHITIDLNGHCIRRKREHEIIRSCEVFLVESKAVFTLRDSDPFSKGYAGIRGGVVTGGAATNYGGGVHIEEDGEFRMEGGTIYDCRTSYAGGGVFVDGRYYVTLRGLTIIKDNRSDESQGVADLALQSKALGTARIINAGLYKGSVVYVGTTSGSGKQITEWISNYQAQYFKTNDGRITESDQRTVNVPLATTGSVIGSGNLIAIVLLGGVGIIAAAILIVCKTKSSKNTRVTEGGEENDKNAKA